jgi:adenylate cyclase
MIRAIRNHFRRRQLKAMFGNYLSPTAIEQALEAESLPPTGPAEREITPFFASIHAYVALAEQLPLPQLRELLDAHFEICSGEIESGGGMLDKFVGDAVVALFGTPFQPADHALHACVAALRCHARIRDLRARIHREGDRWPARARELRLRIGLHTGIAIVGPVSPAPRVQFMMMGDTVNLAARLEAVAKFYGVWTLCSGATRDACRRADPDRVVFRPLGAVFVKGLTSSLELFEPVALRADAPAQLLDCLAEFEAGLTRFRSGDPNAARRHFELSATLERDQPGSSPEIVSNPSLNYLSVLRHAEPPSGNEG